MKYYGYIGTDNDSSEIPVDENTLRYSLRAEDYIPVIENRTDHTMRIVSPAGTTLYPSHDKGSYGNKRNPEPEDLHYNVMTKLADMMKEESQIMFSGITDLSERSEDAVALYHVFQDKGITLEFLNTPWLNSSNFTLSFRTSSSATWDALDHVIRQTILSQREEQVDLTKLSQQDRKTKKTGKGIDPLCLAQQSVWYWFRTGAAETGVCDGDITPVLLPISE
ncbi:MAG: hypothetical protein VZT48_11590 [Bulleidia sp.]|nr:hypothetical protein [Bulleidia sp.]